MPDRTIVAMGGGDPGPVFDYVLGLVRDGPNLLWVGTAGAEDPWTALQINTANMLAIWRLHGFDALLREAWEQGILLTGWSAGMICWFEAGVTDSFGPQLAGMPDGLGFLPGSACPRYDDEELRRPL
jgi:hypothetical protein